jgi:putative flippase GtrA
MYNTGNFCILSKFINRDIIPKSFLYVYGIVILSMEKRGVSMSKLTAWAPRTWRYPIVWVSSRAVDITVTALCIILLGTEYYRISLAIGLVADGLIDFLGLRYWVFIEEKKSRPVLQELTWYYFVRAGSATISVVVAEFVAGKTFGIELIIVYLLASPAIWLIQLALHRWFFTGKIRDFFHLAGEKMRFVCRKICSLLGRVRKC